MRIHVEHKLPEFKGFTIDLPESRLTLFTFPMPAFGIVSAIVHEYAVRGQNILPCTFTIKKPDGNYPITQRDVRGYLNDHHRFESAEKQITLEIIPSRNSPHVIKSIAVPLPIRSDISELFYNPQGGIDEIMEPLTGVTEPIIGGSLDEMGINKLSLIIDESPTINNLCINGVTEKGATALINMLRENFKLKTFEISEISCRKDVEANLYTLLIKTLEDNLRFKNFKICAYSKNEFFFLSREARLRKSARLAYFNFYLIKELFQLLLPLANSLVEIIHEYLSTDDFLVSEDLNSAFMYYLMPQIAWKKLNDQGAYTLDFSSEKELKDFHGEFISEMKGIDLVTKDNLENKKLPEVKTMNPYQSFISRRQAHPIHDKNLLRNKRLSEAATIGFNEPYRCIIDPAFCNRIRLEIPVQLWIFIFAQNKQLLKQFQKISIPVSKSTTLDQQAHNMYNSYNKFTVCAGSKNKRRRI